MVNREDKQLYEKRIKWFKDAGLGMFIHWGLYSVLGHGEWSQWRENIHPLDYAKLANKFTPKKFDAQLWAQLAKDSGAKYVIFTTRHHDGFALWDSKVSNNTSVKTNAQYDFVADYVKAVRKVGLKVGLYYSPMDWSWPAFNMKLPVKNPLAWRDFVTKGPEYDAAAWKQFLAYVHEQVRELMTNYGKIDLFFYDGACWYQSPEQWKYKHLNKTIRRLQPHIIINNRCGLPEDYDSGENEIQVNVKIQRRPWEDSFCINDAWGYLKGDKNYKTLRESLYILLRNRSAGGNLVLNTNPKADGSIPSQCVKILTGIGDWLSKHGESIYEVSLGEMCAHGTGFYSQPGIVTCKPEKCTIYYHILRYMGKNEHCFKADAEIISARLLIDDSKVNFVQKGQMVYFKSLPKTAPDDLDTVIKVKYQPGTARSAWTKNYV